MPLWNSHDTLDRGTGGYRKQVRSSSRGSVTAPGVIRQRPVARAPVVLDHVVTVLLRCRDRYLTCAPASRATRGKLVVEPGLHVAHRVVEDQAAGALPVGTPNDPKDDRRRANEPGFSPVNSPAA